MPPYCQNCRTNHTYVSPCSDAPLATWERELLGSSIATVRFTLISGDTLEFDDVDPDSIGPSAEQPGVIGVEFADHGDRVVHIPFVRFWEVSYR